MELWRPYVISGLIGLLVGIEREKAHPHRKAMGIRSFLLLALLGSIAGGVDETWLGATIAAFAMASIVASYLLLSRAGLDDHGLTTEFAAAIVFAISYASHVTPILSAVLGPLVAMVLVSKRSLHRFTALIRPSELQAAILILLMAVSVLGLLEDRVIDPWGLFNPRKFGLIVVALASMEFFGYILAKALGERKSSLVVGFLGGLVSSTAVLLSSARTATKSPGDSSALLASVIAAKLAAFGEALAIVALVSRPLFLALLLPLGAAIAVGGISLALVAARSETKATNLNLRSPLQLRSVLKLAVFLAVIIGAIGAVQRWVGAEATMGLAFITGLFELHGATMATATMFDHGQVELASAVDIILLAAVASLISKTVLAWTITRGPFSRRLTVVFIGVTVPFLLHAALRAI